MAKTKRKHLAAIAGERKCQPPKDKRCKTADKGLQAGPLNESLAGDDGWIEVRKQRVIILIPALPTTHQSPPFLKQEKEENLRQPLCDPKDVQASTTYFKRRRINTTDHTGMNTNRSKVILKLGAWEEEGVMNKIHISEKDNSGASASNKDAEGQQAMIESNASAMETRHNGSVDADTMLSRPRGRRRDHALGISYYFKRAKRHRRSENCVTEAGSKEVTPSVLGLRALHASGETVDSNIGMQLEKVDFHHVSEKDGDKQKDYEKGYSVGICQGVSEKYMARSGVQVGSPEVSKSAQGDVLHCIAGMSLQQSDSTIPQNNKIDIFKDGDDNSSYKQAACFSLGPNTQDNLLNRPEFESEGAKALITPLSSDSLILSKENFTNVRELEEGQSMPSALQSVPAALVYVNSDRVSNSHHSCPSLSTNEAIRAYTLKKQLEKAGGLKKWLVSLGLERFVEFFEKKNIDETELMHLTMSDLKKMGANAVGPRRKLIWAIGHLCQKLTW